MTAGVMRDADAVRYIVLRKLASGLRHTLMGELQSIQFLAELGGRLLRSGTDDAKTRDCLDKIPLATGEAIETCHSVIEWLRPEEGATTTISEAVGQCVKLAGDDWRMRAIRASVAVADSAAEARVTKVATRELVVTSLLVLTDLYPKSLDIEITADLSGERVLLCLRARVSSRVSPFAPATIYHALGWGDIAVLAAAHGVPCSHENDTITLDLAVRVVTPEAGWAGPSRP